MFSGALINNNLLQSGSWLFGWLRYASPFGYALEGLLVSQMQGQCFLFDPQSSVGGGVSGKDNPAIVCAEITGEVWLLNLGCSPVGETGKGDTCEFTGNTVHNDLIVLGGIRLLLLAFLFVALYLKKGGR